MVLEEPRFGGLSCFPLRLEEAAARAIVAEDVVEALVVAIRPRVPRIDEPSINALVAAVLDDLEEVAELGLVDPQSSVMRASARGEWELVEEPGGSAVEARKPRRQAR